MVNALIPFAFSKDKNRMVSVDEVCRGLECNCICPKCQSLLIAKKGDIKEHHFAHKSDADCEGAFETSIHKMAKQIIKDNGYVVIPVLDARTKKTASREIHFNSVILEEPLKFGGMKIIPDAIGLCGCSVVYIEIFVSHENEEEKINVVKANNITLIEIDLSSLLGKDDVNKAIVEKELYNLQRVFVHHIEQKQTVVKKQYIPVRRGRRF